MDLFRGLVALAALAAARQSQTHTPWTSIRPFEPRTCPRPVDNVSGLGEPPAPGVPWTSRPYCAVLGSAGKREKHCVYSASTFNLGSGMALISTPSVAAGVSDAASDAQAAWAQRHHLTGAAAAGTRFPAAAAAAAEGLAYEVRDLPGRGKGVVALRPIREFLVLMVGFPVLVVHDDFFRQDGGPPPVEAPGMYERALARLGDRERVLSLAQSGAKVGHVVEDIMRVNSFGVVLGDVKHKALYPEVSRINHGCDPNAMGRFNQRTLALDVIATRDISPGEEILISYIPLGLPRAHRQQALSLWGFTCTCDLCRAPEAVRLESDRRRERLVEIQYWLNDESLTYDALRELAAELEEIANGERLVQRMGEYHNGLMTAFLEYGDANSALYHARIASRYCDATAESQGPSCTNLRMNIEMLESWKARVAQS